jgi:hypothetical protein
VRAVKYRQATDRNHAEIAQTLRRVTSVLDVHRYPQMGCDLIARHVRTRAPVFIEIKDPQKTPSARKLTDNELTTWRIFPLNYAVCLTVDDALKAVGL